MKKVIRLMSVICALVLVLSCTLTANAEWLKQPSTISIEKVSKTSAIDGVIDDASGSKKWDQNATDIAVGEYDLFPRTPEECAPFSNVFSVMNMKGYFVYDEEGIYLGVEATDTLPKAASDSSEFWHSSNIQIVLYTNSSRTFCTLAYAGTNKANLFNDEKRSELDIAKVKDYCVKETVSGGTTKLVWEIKFPYEAFWDVKGMEDIAEMKLGIVQSSMAEGYACQAFGKAYSLVYEDLISVDIKRPAGETVNSNADSGNAGGNTIVSASGDGVDLGAAGETGSEVASDATADDTASSAAPAEDNSKTTLIIILAAVAGVIVIGGVVAIILINKKK